MQQPDSGPSDIEDRRTGTGIRAVVRAPDAALLIVTSLVAAVPAAAIGILLILHVKAQGGSYALAGLTAAGYLVGAAVTGPLVGRLVDRHRILPVLGGCTLVTAASLLALATLDRGSADALFPLLAVAGGLTHPPVGAVTRTLLPTVIADEDALHAAYALESSGLEVAYIAGPALIAGLVASRSTSTALVLDAAVLVAGTAWFVGQPAARAWRPAGAARPATGALRAPGVRRLVAVAGVFSVSFGAIEVAVTAAASDLGHRGLTGPLLATWGLGSLIGGVALASRAAPADARRRLLWLLLALAVGDLALVLAAGSWAFAVILPLSGLGIAPAYAVVNAMTGLSATPGTSTEAFAWLGTGISAGFSAGAALAGPAADGAGARGAFGVSLAAVLLAMLVARDARAAG